MARPDQELLDVLHDEVEKRAVTNLRQCAPDLAAQIETAFYMPWAFRRAAVVASARSVASIQQRNRLPGKRFIQRCCLGATAHALGNSVAELRGIAARGST